VSAFTISFVVFIGVSVASVNLPFQRPYHPLLPADFIVELAVAQGKPFAVVPCCVYSREFPRCDQAAFLVGTLWSSAATWPQAA
jgi:hypothetical protein